MKKTAIKMIKWYQVKISPTKRTKCRHNPTCSAYAIEAYETHNFFYASLLTTKRILTCNPLFKPKYDPVPPKRIKKNKLKESKENSIMIFDAHADILTDIYEENKKGNSNSFKEKHLDNYIKSGITHSIFVNWTDPFNKNREDFYNTFDIAINIIKRNSDVMSICHHYDDILKAKKENKIGVILGIEGVKYLDNPEDIIGLYNQGIRHTSLTWNESNDYATGISNTELGLTDKGIKLIKLMEELGMIIDLSHANEKTFEEIVKLTKGSIIVSHGNAKALCDHPRNYTDKQLQMIKDKNGVIGVCAVASFISKEKENQNVDFLAKHIDYIVKLIGIDHVGIGLDVCYYLSENKTSTNVEGLETIAETKNLLTALKNLGYSDKDIEKIAHGNFDRVLKEIL